MKQVGTHKDYTIWQTADGMHEAFRSIGRKEADRPVGGATWNGSDIVRIVLSSQDYDNAIEMLERKLKKPAKQYPPIGAQPKLFDGIT